MIFYLGSPARLSLALCLPAVFRKTIYFSVFILCLLLSCFVFFDAMDSGDSDEVVIEFVQRSALKYTMSAGRDFFFARTGIEPDFFS